MRKAEISQKVCEIIFIRLRNQIVAQRYLFEPRKDSIEETSLRTKNKAGTLLRMHFSNNRENSFQFWGQAWTVDKMVVKR
jgi:hypothetical protein